MSLSGPVTLVNGLRAASIPVTDRGLLYGDGVFETIRLQHQRPLLLDEHLHRLARGCELLGLEFAVGDIAGQMGLLLQQAEVMELHRTHESSILKIIVTRGDGGRGYAPAANQQCRSILQLHPLPSGYDVHASNGISCMVCQHPVSDNPALAGIKHLNRLDQVMGSRELQRASQTDSSVQEGLMCNSHGQLIEGTRSNVFLNIAGRLCTPDLGTAGVAGIMRDALLAWWRHQGTAVEVRAVTRDELQLASEVLICNSVIGVWPVNRIYLKNNSEPVVLHQHELARAAQRCFTELLDA